MEDREELKDELLPRPCFLVQDQKKFICRCDICAPFRVFDDINLFKRHENQAC